MINFLEIATGVIVRLLLFWKNKVFFMNLLQEARHASFEYGRYGNPTTEALEEKMRYEIPFLCMGFLWLLLLLL